MGEVDYDTTRDEMERDSLQKTISEVETALAGSTSGTRSVYENFLQNARGRVGVLDKKIKESQTEKEQRARDDVAIALAAQRETALSSREKETYSGFLKKDFFTKQDFGQLEQFYEKTWDRLSDGGKNEMSKRVWEGVRRDEYKFSDLPKVVQEKETDWAYEVLKRREVGASVSQIPKGDRDDFIRSYESGKREKASEVLDRKSFRENMFLSAASKETNDIAATTNREAEAKVVEANISAPPAKQPDKAPPKISSKSDIDASAFNLDGLKISEAPATVSSRDIPAAATAPKAAQSFRGS